MTTDFARLTRLLLTSLEASLPYLPEGEPRFLAEDAIADTRHALHLPPATEAPPPQCGQRCGVCQRCKDEDAQLDEMSTKAEADLAELLAMTNQCPRCAVPLTPFGLDNAGVIHPGFPCTPRGT